MNRVLGNAGKLRLNDAAILLALSLLEGIVAVIWSLLIPSEPGAAVLFGLSPIRVAILGMMIVMIAFLGWLYWATRNKPLWRQRVTQMTGWVIRSPERIFLLFAAILILLLVILAFLALYIGSDISELTILRSVYSRMGPLIAWVALMLLQLLGWIVSNPQTGEQIGAFSTMPLPLRAGALVAIVTCIYVSFLRIFLTRTFDLRFRGMEPYLFLPALVLLLWGAAHPFVVKQQKEAVFRKWMMFLFIGVFVYTLYWHTAKLVHFDVTRDSATWHLLASSFLEGKPYLENPSSTHDLTFYQGHWYVPSPPLPALLLLPFVAILGVDRINMVQVAILCGAINAVLVYAMLSKASALKMAPTSTAGNLWLTAVLAFGTTHWWLSVYGIYWLLSQLLTLLFACLAVILALKKRSPWLIGLSLGIAILSRPNVFTLWPFLAGITLYLEQQESGAIAWKQAFFWAFKTAFPVIGCVALLLFYNLIRFENFFDFGYVNVTSSSWITEAVQAYGMFNFHFLPINFRMMFFTMPAVGIVAGKLYYSPGFGGTSILAMTPAILYLFRRWRMNWWTIGAWASILLTAGLLLLYHNTGAWQLGYRYLMDFILPVLLLMAVGIGQRIPIFFVLLALFSFFINAAGINWWFTHM